MGRCGVASSSRQVSVADPCEHDNELSDLRGRKWQEAGEDCLMKSFIICALRQIL
jgi:hypothetical protein